MAQLNFHNDIPLPPQQNRDNFPILTCLKDGYLIWHGFLTRLPRATRYTLGAKIDNLFTDIITNTLNGKYSKPEQKLVILKQASAQLDTLKYFTTMLWELKALDNKKYATLANKLSFVGQMIGGLLRDIQK